MTFEPIVPFWELASSLAELSVHPLYGDTVELGYDAFRESPTIVESAEEEVTSFELPSAPFDEVFEARMALH